jgi:NAD(P)-dependent dehydrogenase (short-subunit alcohol dehydrogenase family)
MSEARGVLITGCSRGIGLHTALALAQRGWRVTATLRGDEGRAILEEAGVRVAHLDLLDQPLERAREIVAEHGPLDALVANAGYGLFGCFEDLEPDEIRQLLEVNLFGAMASARAALPALRASRGRLVLVGSIAGRRAAPGSSAYNCSKFALEGWAEALRHELAPFGVPVVVVEPGLTRTGFASARVRGRRVGGGAYQAITERLDALHRAKADDGAPVDSAVRAIVRALEQRSPPLRIQPTASARAEVLATRLLPGALYELLVRTVVRLPRA